MEIQHFSEINIDEIDYLVDNSGIVYNDKGEPIGKYDVKNKSWISIYTQQCENNCICCRSYENSRGYNEDYNSPLNHNEECEKDENCEENWRCKVIIDEICYQMGKNFTIYDIDTDEPIGIYNFTNGFWDVIFSQDVDNIEIVEDFNRYFDLKNY